MRVSGNWKEESIDSVTTYKRLTSTRCVTLNFFRRKQHDRVFEKYEQNCLSECLLVDLLATCLWAWNPFLPKLSTRWVFFFFFLYCVCVNARNFKLLHEYYSRSRCQPTRLMTEFQSVQKNREIQVGTLCIFSTGWNFRFVFQRRFFFCMYVREYVPSTAKMCSTSHGITYSKICSCWFIICSCW